GGRMPLADFRVPYLAQPLGPMLGRLGGNRAIPIRTPPLRPVYERKSGGQREERASTLHGSSNVLRRKRLVAGSARGRSRHQGHLGGDRIFRSFRVSRAPQSEDFLHEVTAKYPFQRAIGLTREVNQSGAVAIGLLPF